MRLIVLEYGAVAVVSGVQFLVDIEWLLMLNSLNVKKRAASLFRGVSTVIG